MTQDSMNSGWYYARADAPAGSETGPLSWEELYLLAHGGTLKPDDIVWNPRLPRGVTARLIPGLFAAPAVVDMRPVAAAPQPAVAAVAAQPPVEPPGPTAPQVGPAAAPPAEPEAAFAPSLTEPLESPPHPAKGQGRSLPLLVVLLVLILAAAGLATYFLFLRDTGESSDDAGQTLSTPSLIATVSALGDEGDWRPHLFTRGTLAYTGQVGGLSELLGDFCERGCYDPKLVLRQDRCS